MSLRYPELLFFFVVTHQTRLPSRLPLLLELLQNHKLRTQTARMCLSCISIMLSVLDIRTSVSSRSYHAVVPIVVSAVQGALYVRAYNRSEICRMRINSLRYT